jgi:hypothetical protein
VPPKSGTALVSSMMEPIALTKSSPHTAGAGHTAVGLRLLKQKRASAGKQEARGSPRAAFLGRLLVGSGTREKRSEPRGFCPVCEVLVPCR